MTGRLRMRDAGATLLAGVLLVTGLAVGSGGASASDVDRPESGQPAGPTTPDDQLVEPHDDPFYTAPPGFETAAPGTVFHTRSVDIKGYGFPTGLEATQFLARSTNAKGNPTTVAGTLILPPTPEVADRPRPLLSYQPATDSLGDQCNPSYALRAGNEKEFGLIHQSLQQGWAVVVTDYQGADIAFAAGRMEGHGVLDGIRAAKSIPGQGLTGRDTPVGLWGYSGGGLASSWAAELAPTYAPELNIVGIASGGTPSDLAAAARMVDGGPASGLVFLASAGIAREYPEMLTLLNNRGRAMIDEIADMCVGEASMRYPFQHLADYTVSPDPLSEPVAKAVMEENHLGRTAPAAPVYLFHSVFDELIPFATAKQLEQDWCARGANVSFSADYLSEHTVLAITGAGQAISFLGDRFEGKPAPNGCR